jgi:hypothetical protein
MILDIPAIAKDEILFHHVLVRGILKTMQYSADAIKIRDSLGPVPVYSQDSKDKRQRKFFARRNISSGQLIVEYQATPWNPTETSPSGSQIALERDGGGLTAAGMSFILRPAMDGVVDITLEWDLSSTPSGTRAACSLGEGQENFEKAEANVLDECSFAIGTLHSYPPGETGGKFGSYWLENPPFDATNLGEKMEALLPKMTSFSTTRTPPIESSSDVIFRNAFLTEACTVGSCSPGPRLCLVMRMRSRSF